MGPLDSRGYRYRPLVIGDEGWDIFALQTALYGLNHDPRGIDGLFGPGTDKAVLEFQERFNLNPDGVAGIITQRTISLQLIWPRQRQNAIPPGLLRGQIEKESGFQLGNHSPRYDDGAFDVGVTQRNTNYVSYEVGFSAAASVAKLAQNTRQKYDKYKAIGKIKDERRLWELAAGSWNAPAWTDRLANGRTLSQSQKDWIEAYIRRVCIYLKL